MNWPGAGRCTLGLLVGSVGSPFLRNRNRWWENRSHAGNAPNVSGLAPDRDESVAGLLQRLNAPMPDFVPDDEGVIWPGSIEHLHQLMAGDLPLARARQLAAVQQPIAARSFSESVTQAAWRAKPSWYLQTTGDRMLPPAVQETMAQQMGAKVLKLPASHLSTISRPDDVAAWIDRAAQDVVRHTALPAAH